jgi:hypothetical protein
MVGLTELQASMRIEQDSERQTAEQQPVLVRLAFVVLPSDVIAGFMTYRR